MLSFDFPSFLWHVSIPDYKHIKIWGLVVYIINGRVTRNNTNNISYLNYFVGYAATTGCMLYWKTDHIFYIYIANHAWFDEYNYCISTESNHTPGYLILRQDPDSLIS